MSRPKATSNLSAPFQSSAGASRVTGMSVKWIREGCKSGTIPHILVGTDFRVNVPALLEMLDRQSREGVS